MSIYTTIQYLHYRRKALTRHGVHSPFVYSFIEQVLHSKSKVSEGVPVSVHGDVVLLASKYKRLLGPIDTYCRPASLRIISISEADAWVKHELPLIPDNDVVMVTGIHSKPEPTAVWDMLRNHAHIKLSIDLYGVGLLFFKNEFKEQQHFVLRY